MGEHKKFLTQLDGFAGPIIPAESFEDARKITNELGLKLDGELVEIVQRKREVK